MKKTLLALTAIMALQGCAPGAWKREGGGGEAALAALMILQAGQQAKVNSLNQQQQDYQQYQQYQQQQQTNKNLECINHSLKGESWVGC